MKKITPLCLAVIFVLGTAVSQADKTETLPAGVPIITSADLEKFQVEIAPELTGKTSDYAIKQVVSVDRMPFDKAIRIQTLGPKSEDQVRLVMTAPKPIADNDVLFLTFYVRASQAVRAESGAGVQIKFTRVKFNRANSLAQEERIPVKKTWTRIQLPFRSSGDWDPTKDPSRLVFCLGFPDQTVEIGGIELVNFGGNFDIRKLPHPKNTYAGRELNAPWRKAAAERIEKIRKGNLTIQVTDAQGRPVPGATASVVQTEHAFPFGTKIDELLVMEDERYLKGYGVSREDCVKYRQAVLDLFNLGSVNYCLSWPVFEYIDNPDPNNRGRRKSEMGLETIQWLKKHGKRACGTQLIWPQYIPKDIQDFKENGEKIKTRARKYIVNVVQAVPENEGWLAFNECAWDLDNPGSFPEMFFSRVGREFMVEGFKLAHKTNPRAKYFLNDCRLEAWGGMEKERQQAVEDQLRFLLKHGAPVDGIGLQSHFVNSVMTPPERVLQIFDRYAKVVKEILITEYDTDTMDEKLRADYLRDYLTLAFSHPAVCGFIHWSLWEGRSIPNLSLFKKDWTPTPAVKVWKDLVFNQWRTNQTGKTDQKGVFSLRGFLGDYEISVSSSGKTLKSKAKLVKVGTVITMQMKPD